MRRQVRSLKADLKNHSSYHSYNKKIGHLRSDFEEEWAKQRESKKRGWDYQKKCVVIERGISRKEKNHKRRKLDLEKCFDEAGRWKKEAAAERGRRRSTEKEMKALEQKLKKTQIQMNIRKKSSAKERKALQRQINAGLRESLQLQILRKEFEIQNKGLHDMKASMKNVSIFSKKEKNYLQEENTRLQKKLNTQQEKILALQRLHLNLSRSASNKRELTTLKSKVVELKGREALFISEVAREKKKICILEKENARLLAEQRATGVGKVDDVKMKTLEKKLTDLKKLFKKNDEKRRKLNNDVKITKGMFSEMETEYKTLKIGNSMHDPRKVKTPYEFDLKRETVDSLYVEGISNSRSLCTKHQQAPPKNPNTNPGSPAAKKPTAQSQEKNQTKILHNQKRELIFASKTSGGISV